MRLFKVFGLALAISSGIALASCGAEGENKYKYGTS